MMRLAKIPFVFICIGFAELCLRTPRAIAKTAHDPISFVEVAQARTPSPIALSASATAATIVGTETFSTGLAPAIEYDDLYPFGPVGKGRGWLLRDSVRVSRESAVVNLALNVIVDAPSSSVLVAYTDQINPMPAPVVTAPDPAEVAERDGWVMGADIPDHMQSTVIEVIEKVWIDHGFDPREVSRIIIRPRWISAKYPAREVGGVIVPLRPTEKVWLVQVSGKKMHESIVRGKLVYFTGKMLQYRDGSLEYLRGFLIP